MKKLLKILAGFNPLKDPSNRQVTLLAATTVGAGIFALPFAFREAGWLLGLVLFCLSVLLVLAINYSYSLLVLGVKTKHELVGYAQIYLGHLGKTLVFILLIILVNGAILAYANLGGSFLALLFGKPEASFQLGLDYMIILSTLVLLGIKGLSRLDLFVFLAVCFLISFLFGFTIFKISPSNLFSLVLSFQKDFKLGILEPLGIFLFALSGFTIIPDVVHLGHNKKQVARVIFLGTLLPTFLYLLFVFTVLGVVGQAVTPEAIFSLFPHVPSFVLQLVYVLGILTMTMAFLGLAHVFKKSLEEDLKIGMPFSWFLTIYPPLFLYLFLEPSFLQTVSLSGLLATIVVVTLIFLMLIKAYERKIFKTIDNFLGFSFRL